MVCLPGHITRGLAGDLSRVIRGAWILRRSELMCWVPEKDAGRASIIRGGPKRRARVEVVTVGHQGKEIALGLGLIRVSGKEWRGRIAVRIRQSSGVWVIGVKRLGKGVNGNLVPIPRERAQ